MMTMIAGVLSRIGEDEVRLRVGAIEYQVLVPESVRRAVQMRLGEEVAFHILEYIEGNPTKGGRMVPRLVGFVSEPEIEFFELFCTVDGIGVKTALKAMVRPVRDVAGMIQRQDVQMLATLPGISSSTAERVIAKLRKKVAKFALMVPGDKPAEAGVEPSVLDEAFLALVSVGHSEADARKLLDGVLAGGKKFKSVADVLQAIFQQM
jgi:Holliday junction DNA helicase RuvA